MFKFTKTQGPWANFQTHCFKCTQVITVTNSRPDPHDCRQPQPGTLAELYAALDTRQAR
jgi:hypothetical protein